MMQNIFKLVIISFLLISTSQGIAQTGHWEELKPKHSPPPRASFGMADIGEGKVIINGGLGIGEKMLDDTWIYDYKTNDWTEVTTETKPPIRYNHRLARISEKKVLLFGGCTYTDWYNDTWIFDLDSNKWTEMNPTKKPAPRDRHAMAQIDNNKVLLYSGWVTEYDYPYGSDYWIYDLENNVWDSIKTSNKYGQGTEVGCSMLDSGKVITFGGWAGLVKDGTCIFDISKNTWNKILPKQIATPLGQVTMSSISKNTLLLFGGSGKGDSNAFLDDTWVFTLHDTTWRRLAPLGTVPRRRVGHSMTKIAENKVLLFGGVIEEPSNARFAGDTWIFTLDGTGIDDNGNNKYESESFKFKIIANNISLIINKPMEMQIVISDILGRELECIDTGILGTGEHSFRLNTNLNNGLYIVSAIYDGQRYTYKYMICE